MNVYAESSAVLAWLFEEANASSVESALDQADLIVASDLTLAECARSLIRSHAIGSLSELEMSRRWAALEASSIHWTLLRIDGEVLERARRRFPVEPVRTLDALHLASAIAARSVISDLALLSLDQRIRDNGTALGFNVLPSPGAA
jgi:predicted nucleic acid-binding protein